MGLLVLVAATLLVVIGAVSWTRLLRPNSAFDAAVTFGVVASASSVLALELAGAAGQLRRGPVFIVAALISVPAIVLARPSGFALRMPSLARVVRADLWTSALVALAGVALLWQKLVALTLPPYGYDALTYHLSTVSIWIQQGDFSRSQLSACCSHYPFTSDLSFAWPMLFTGNDSFVNLVQLGYAVLGAAAVAGIANSLGLPARFSVAAGALFVVTPIVLVQAPTEYVDLMLAAWVLAALHSLLRFSLSAEPRQLVVAGLSTAMVLGTKGTGILWAVALAVTALVVVVAAVRGHRLSGRGAAAGIGAVVIACLALGSFWYIRNWVDEGNPLYPFRVELAGVRFFDGPKDVSAIESAEVSTDEAWPVAVARSWAADLDFWNQDGIDYQQRSGGLGPVWAWLGIPLLVIGGAVLLWRRQATAMPLVVLAVVFALQPYKWWSRFTIPLAAAGAIAVVAGATLAPWRRVRDVIRLASLLLAVAGVALASMKVVPAGRAEALRAPDVLELVGDRPTVGEVFHHEYAFTEQIPRHATVVVDLPAEAVRFVYPLFAPDLDRRVVPLGPRVPLEGRWVVTERGRPVDRRLEAEGRHVLVSDRRDLRAWRPRP